MSYDNHSSYEALSRSFFEGLSDDEHAVVDFYTNYGFMDINNYLMGRGNPVYKDLAEDLSLIIDIHGYNTFSGMPLYRGTRLEHFERYNTGDSVDFPLFLSTTENMKVASRFARGENPAVLCFDNIDSVFAPVTHPTEADKEAEFLIQSNNRFLIEGIEKVKSFGGVDKHVTLIHMTSCYY